MRKILAFLPVVLILCLCQPAYATVQTTVTMIPYVGTGTSTFAVTFPFQQSSDLVLKKYTGACGSATYATLTLNTDYTVTRTSTGGTVVTTAPVAVGYCLRIYRTVAYTQTTSFVTQGTFNAKAHEDALDKLTMEVQQVAAGATLSAETTAALEAHKVADDHTIYFKLTGRAGGQVGYGGTAAGEGFTLHSTTHATKGPLILGPLVLSEVTGNGDLTGYLKTGTGIESGGPSLFDDTVEFDGDVTMESYLQGGTNLLLRSNASGSGLIYLGASSAFDEATTRLGIGIAAPTTTLDVVGSATITGTIYGGKTTGHALTLSSTSYATKGKIYLGASSAFDEANTRLGVGTASPSAGYALHVVGNTLAVGYVAAERPFAAATTDGTVVVPGGCNSVNTQVTNNKVLHLPAASTAPGCQVTLINANGTVADIAMIPHAGDTLKGICVGSSGAVDIAASSDYAFYVVHGSTHVNGAAATVVSDGVSNWWLVSCLGNWATQAGYQYWQP